MTLEELKSRAAAADHFTLLGLPHAYAIDADLLKKNYLALARITHPDFYTGDPDSLPEILALSAAVNEAYRTLADPVRRAEYLLLAHGGKDAGQDKRVPPEMLGEVLMLNEEIADAKAANDTAALAAFRSQMESRRDTLQAEIECLATRLTTTPESSAAPQTLGDLRLQLNTMKYVHNLLAQLAG